MTNPEPPKPAPSPVGTATVEPPWPPAWLKKWYTRAVSFIALALAVIGVAGWLHDRPKTDLVYYVSPASAVIVQSGQVSRLATSYDGKPITSDISATQVAIWNLGNLAVKPANVLSPVILETENGLPILEATVRDSNRPNVIGAAFDLKDSQKGIVGLTWRIMEPGDGFSVQLVYGGKPGASIHASGVFEGEKALRQAVPPGPQAKPSTLAWPTRSAGTLTTLLVIVGLAAAVTALLEGIKWTLTKLKVSPNQTVIGVVALVLVLGSITLVQTCITPDTAPPFPF